MTVVIKRIVRAEEDGLSAIRRALGYTGAEIERSTGLPRGVVSAVERGRLYAYPRFRNLVTGFLAAGTGMPFDSLHARLFPDFDRPEIQEPGEARAKSERAGGNRPAKGERSNGDYQSNPRRQPRRD